MIERGQIRWVDLGPAVGSAPAKRRPVVVVSADDYNRTRLRTVVVVAMTSNTAAAAFPGNVFLPAAATGLRHDSVVNVTAVATVDRDHLTDLAGEVPSDLLRQVDAGLRGVLAL